MIPSIKLNNGYSCPILGFGTARMHGDECYEAVKHAIDVGYRHVDCAFLYGNEKDVGRAISEKIDDGVVKRSDLFITGKLWNSFHREVMVRPALEKSLSDLGVDYLDLYLIHWPMAFKDGWETKLMGPDGRVPYSDAEFTDTWEIMENLVREGLIRSIGVSNFNQQQIEWLLKCAQIKPVMNQVECHPYLNQSKMLEFCRSKDIAMTGYRVLGLLNDPRTAIHDPLISDMAKKYGKTRAQVMIKFQLERGVIAIAKSSHHDNIQSNLDVFDFELETDDMAFIMKLDKGKKGRQMDVPYARDHRNYPFKEEHLNLES